MSKLLKNKKFYVRKLKDKKKHVETMFTTTKEKKYPYYFINLKKTVETNKNKYKLLKGSFYLKSLKKNFVSIESLKSCMRIFKWFIKSNKLEKKIIFNLNVFPDQVFTSKPKDVRMGKGKGKPNKKMALILPGQNILSINTRRISNYNFLITGLLKKLTYKLPPKIIIAKNNW